MFRETWKSSASELGLRPSWVFQPGNDPKNTPKNGGEGMPRIRTDLECPSQSSYMSTWLQTCRFCWRKKLVLVHKLNCVIKSSGPEFNQRFMDGCQNHLTEVKMVREHLTEHWFCCIFWPSRFDDTLRKSGIKWSTFHTSWPLSW